MVDVSMDVQERPALISSALRDWVVNVGKELEEERPRWTDNNNGASSPSIFRVPPHLLEVSGKSYTPKFFAFGLYDLHDRKISRLDDHRHEFASIFKEIVGISSWSVICSRFVGGSVANLVGLYDDLDLVSEQEVDTVKNLLCLDAVFQVCFIQGRHQNLCRMCAEKYPVINEVIQKEPLWSGRSFVLFDIFLFQSQIPLELIRSAVHLLAASLKPGKSTSFNPHNTSEADVDPLLKFVGDALEMIYCNLPGFFVLKETIQKTRFDECKHLLECLYIVVCHDPVKIRGKTSLQESEQEEPDPIRGRTTRDRAPESPSSETVAQLLWDLDIPRRTAALPSLVLDASASAIATEELEIEQVTPVIAFKKNEAVRASGAEPGQTEFEIGMRHPLSAPLPKFGDWSASTSSFQGVSDPGDPFVAPRSPPDSENPRWRKRPNWGCAGNCMDCSFTSGDSKVRRRTLSEWWSAFKRKRDSQQQRRSWLQWLSGFKFKASSNHSRSWSGFFFRCLLCVPLQVRPRGARVVIDHIPTLTRLKNVGVQVAVGEAQYISEVSFKSHMSGFQGTLYLPAFDVFDETEGILRNLATYEHVVRKKNDLLSYIKLMDNLIDTEEDVELLMRRGVLRSNHRANNKEVADMWNTLLLGYVFTLSPHYQKLFEDISDHYSQTSNVRFEEFRQLYLARPWLVGGVVIGIAVVVLTLTATLIATIYSVLSYYHQGD